MDISLSDIRYFKTAAAAGNLSKASDILGIRQSSLSAAIQRVETALDTRLFFRSKRGVTLTRAGEYFLTHSKELVEKWESLRERTHHLSSEVQGRFTLGCHPTPGSYFLPRILPGLFEKFPLLDIGVVHDNSPDLVQDVLEHRIDLAIVTDPPRHPDLVSRVLRKDTVGFWTKRPDVPPADSILICDPGLKHSQLLLGKLEARRIRFSKQVESSSLDVISRLVAGGLGVGILPGIAVDALQDPRISLMESLPSSKGEICLVLRHELLEVKAVNAMLRMIGETPF